MKNGKKVFLSLLVIAFMAGCGSTEEKVQKLVCTSTQKEDGMIAEQVISMTYKNDKLKQMTMEVNTKITDSTVQKNWEVFKKSMDEDNQEFNKEGVSLTTSSNDQTYEYKTTLDIDLENASEEALKEQGFEDLKKDTSTLQDSKEAAEKDGETCKIEEIK